MTDATDTLREICDVLDALILMVKLDRAPVRAVAILERAQSETKAYLEKFDPELAAS
jgi:hypothetical protein